MKCARRLAKQLLPREVHARPCWEHIGFFLEAAKTWSQGIPALPLQSWFVRMGFGCTHLGFSHRQIFRNFDVQVSNFFMTPNGKHHENGAVCSCHSVKFLVPLQLCENPYWITSGFAPKPSQGFLPSNPPSGSTMDSTLDLPPGSTPQIHCWDPPFRIRPCICSSVRYRERYS